MAAQQNGDAYGTSRFTCNSCDYKTSFHYDEASDPYYYETRDWSRNPVRQVAHDYAGLPPVTIDPDGSENRRRQAADKEGEWKKVDGKWVPA
mmetsp:Transcript_86178/g.129163  ORF Transcript_86178/g.129163 Transcript_86178/m.129163 type:complete len:92 (+) Transcript_86178:223-498(+)